MREVRPLDNLARFAVRLNLSETPVAMAGQTTPLLKENFTSRHIRRLGNNLRHRQVFIILGTAEQVMADGQYFQRLKLF